MGLVTALSKATVGVGTVLIWDFSVADTMWGGGWQFNFLFKLGALTAKTNTRTSTVKETCTTRRFSFSYTNLHCSPKVVYNRRTNRYVLWYNFIKNESPVGGRSSVEAVAVADAPTGPFRIVNGNVSLLEPRAGDFDVFVDDDAAATAYLIYTAYSCSAGAHGDNCRTQLIQVQGCSTREGAPEAAPEAVRQAVGGGCGPRGGWIGGWSRLPNRLGPLRPQKRSERRLEHVVKAVGSVAAPEGVG